MDAYRLYCRQRGCHLPDPVAEIPDLCPVCENPLIPGDETWHEVSHAKPAEGDDPGALPGDPPVAGHGGDVSGDQD